MQEFMYDTAKALTAISRFYASKNIKIGIGQPRTDGDTIWIPSLPKQMTKPQLDRLRAFIDHEAAHIRYNSFYRDWYDHPTTGESLYASPMEWVSTHWGNAGKVILNSLEDARIEAMISAEFEGVTFDALHDEFKQTDLGEAADTKALIHTLYMNGRHGWGHHPGCAFWEQTLAPFKDKIMEAHTLHLRNTVHLAGEIAEYLNGLSSSQPPDDNSDQPEDDSSGDNTDDSSDDSSGDNADASGDGSGDDSDGGDSDADGDSDGAGNSDADSVGDGDGDTTSEGSSNSDDTSGDGDGGSSADGEQPEDGVGDISDGADGGESQDDSGVGAGGGGSKSMLDTIDGDEQSDAGSVLREAIESDGDDTITNEDLNKSHANIRLADNSHCSKDPTGKVKTSFVDGLRRGSMLGRLVAARISAIDTATRTPPRSSGQHIDRGNLARFGVGITNRILTRESDCVSVNTDIVLCLDNSSSIDYCDYDGLFNAAGCLSRGLTMAGASVGAVSFGEDIRILSPISRRPFPLNMPIPDFEGNTNTGQAMIVAHEMLSASSGNRKIVVVLTDGVPGTCTAPAGVNSDPPTPCLDAMRMLHRSGMELIVVPFGIDIKTLKAWRQRVLNSRPQYAPQHLPFIDYMLNEGVFVGPAMRSPAEIAKQIVQCKGDLRRYV